MDIRNRTSAAKIQSAYVPIIHAAVKEYRDTLGEAVISIRLLGSVARGDAIIGQSDIDFVALIDRPVLSSALAYLYKREGHLAAEYPVVRKVDMEVDEVHAMPEVRHFILATDSLLVHGADTIPHGEQTIDRSHLIELVTPNAIDLIQGYIGAIERESDPIALRGYARVAGKDLLRVLRGRALGQGAPYETSMKRIHDTVREYASKNRELADGLYMLYRSPAISKQDLLALLARAEHDLL